MKIYNNNPAFGDCGPFDIDAPTFRLACHMLANEMQSSFKTWAEEQGEVEVENGIPYEHVERSHDERIAEMRREFLKGLTEMVAEKIDG
jgi:hypothetical protein